MFTCLSKGYSDEVNPGASYMYLYLPTIVCVMKRRNMRTKLKRPAVAVEKA
jgi:hypothetical protein